MGRSKRKRVARKASELSASLLSGMIEAEASLVRHRVEVLLKDSQLVQAFTAAIAHFYKIHRALPDAPVGVAAALIYQEVARGFPSALREDEILVMYSCRRLMELTALVAEWRYDPQRMQQWLEEGDKEGDKVFKFGNVTDRLRVYGNHADNVVVREKREYVHHSRSIHVAPWQVRSTLSDYEHLIEEVVGHVNAAMREMALLMERIPEIVPEIPGVPRGLIPDLWWHAWEWREARMKEREDALAPYGVCYDRSPVIPRDWAFEGFLKKMET